MDTCIVLHSLIQVAVVIQSISLCLLDARNLQRPIEVRLHEVIARAYYDVTVKKTYLVLATCCSGDI